jgi:hypothetical protein
MAQGLTSTPQKREKGNDMGGAVSGLVSGVGDVISGGVDVAGKMLKPAEKVLEWSTENPLEAAALATGAYLATPAIVGALSGTGAAAGTAAAGATGTGLTAGSTGLGLTGAGTTAAGGLGAGLGTALGAETALAGGLGGSTVGGVGLTAGGTALGGIGAGIGSTIAGGAGAGAGAGLLGGAVNWAAANPLAATGIGLTAAKALGGSTPSSSTSTTSIDPEMKAAYLRNLEEARTTAGALGEKKFSDFSANYGTAEKQLRDLGIGGVGQTGTAEASRLTEKLSGYTPDQIRAATGAQYMGAYQNPYENQVVQSTINDLDIARMRQGLADRASATAAKAFGGSRQGVAEALTNEASMRNLGSIVSNLRSAGFNTAAQLGQADASRFLSADQSNQSAGLQGAGLRLNAAGQMGNLAGQYQNLGIAGANAVMQSEAQRQALEQAKLDAARNLSLERLGISQSALGLQPANLGGSTTTPIYKNTSASALGGALSGGMLGNMIGGSTGAGYGAIAGGLLGFL